MFYKRKEGYSLLDNTITVYMWSWS